MKYAAAASPSFGAFAMCYGLKIVNDGTLIPRRRVRCIKLVKQ
jgi:hypothetical protein